MEGLGHISDDPISNTNWNVYKDAFNPPPPRQRLKAWERAPVAAHAPRLQGQKIWKKAGLRSGDNKENDSNILREGEAQTELAKEGVGARKKRRVMGAKEDISLAGWKEMSALSPMKVAGENSRLSLAVQSEDALQMIPRKRTNADRVISPQKRERKIALIEEMVGESVKAELPDKPLRRRKSLRKSTRRSTLASLESSFGELPEKEMAPARLPETLFDISHPTPRISLDSNAILEVASIPIVEQTEQAPPKTSMEKLGDKESIAGGISSTTTREMYTTEQDAEKAPDPEGLPMSKPIADQLELEADSELATEKPIDSASVSMSDSVEEAEKQIFDDTMGQEEVSNKISNSSQKQTLKDPLSTRQQAETDPILTQPASEDLSKDATQTPIKVTKPVATPRSKRRTSQRQGTRRSTRTRASCSHIDGDAVNEIITVEAAPSLGLEPSPVKNGSASSCKEKLQDTFLPIIDEQACDGNAATSTKSDGLSIEVVQECSPSHIEIKDQKVETDLNTPEPAAQEQIPTEAQNEPDVTTVVESVLEEDSIPSESPEEPSEEVDLEAFDDTMSEADSSNQSLTEVSCQLSLELINSLPTQSPISENRVPRHSPSSSITENTVQVDSDESSPQQLEELEPISIPLPAIKSLLQSNTNDDDTFDVSKASSTLFEAPEAPQDKPPVATYDNDETDMLRNFLSRVKADKAAKAETAGSKRKRSLPHSPLQIPLGESVVTADSPSSPRSKDEFDVSLPSASPSKRRKRNAAPPSEDEEVTEPRSIRRSGRTRLPVKTTNLPAPSLIPFRRIGQEGDNTITIRRSEEKELAALTRVNTRKNKGAALCPADVLAKKGEKEDPASRQRHLKEIFDEKASKKKSKKAKSVVWAEEIAQFQTADGKEKKIKALKEKEVKEAKVVEKEIEITTPAEKAKPSENVKEKGEKAEIGKEKSKQEKKSSIPRVGMKSRIARAATNGTPMRKRGRS